jgi:hypothetical protein
MAGAVKAALHHPNWTVVGDTITSLTLPGSCPTGLDCSNMSTTVQDIAVRPEFSTLIPVL